MIWKHGISFLSAPKNGGFMKLINRLIADYYERTPGGAYHFLYRCENIDGSQKLATRPKKLDEMKHDKDKIKTLIEIKGKGGFIVTAPSFGSVRIRKCHCRSLPALSHRRRLPS
jgi:hypothetical protein